MADVVRPWEVSYAEYKALETSLEPNSETIKLSINITNRLANGKKYGHVVGHLYQQWVEKVGEEAAEAWWTSYAAWRGAEKVKSETKGPDGWPLNAPRKADGTPDLREMVLNYFGETASHEPKVELTPKQDKPRTGDLFE